MKAYQFRSKTDAGLVLVGREDGEYQWLGEDAQWRKAELNEQLFEAGL